MKIYINNEEVICASKMTIKEQLKNTSSVILNNVYPKSWETDKDYVSRFYMPSDYSHCAIKNDNTETVTYNLINNVYFINNRYYRNGQLRYEDCVQTYIKVVPGLKYKIKFTNHATTSGYAFSIYQTNSLNIGTVCTLVNAIGVNETKTIEFTPTKKYIFTTYKFYTVECVTIDEVTTTVTDNIIFSGIVKNSGKIDLNPRAPHYSTLQILDYKTFLSEGDNLNYVLESQTVLSAIRTIVKDLDGFMVGNVELEDNGIIAPYNCNAKTPYDVFEYLAEITNSIWFTKVVSEGLVLVEFYSEGNLAQADNIEYNQSYFQNSNIQDISYSYSANNYRNKQVILSEGSRSGTTQTEFLTYNGSNLQTIYPVESIVSITSGSSTYSTASVEAKNSGIYATFYYTYDSNNIEVNKSFPTGKVFKVTYYSLTQTRQAVYNQNEIDRISESTGRNGIIARYEKRTDTNDSNALNQIAQSYLNYKGTPEITLVVKTYNKDLFEIGEKVFFNGPLNSLKTNYLVIEKQINMITTGSQQEFFYEYKLSSSFNDESAINYFDNQRRKLIGNIKEGEYITRFIDFPSETNITFYDLAVINMVIPNDILDGELDIELIGVVNSSLNTTLNFKL